MHSRLIYTRKGAGEPVVLIHGIGHRRQAWNPIFDLLAEKYDVISVDLAGFGESPAYPSDVAYNMDTAAENLIQNFEEWGISRPHVVGNSLGGAIALELGARGYAQSVTALSPAGFFGLFNRLQAFFALVVLRLIAFISPEPVLKFVTKSKPGRKLATFLLFENPDRLTAEEAYGDSLALKHCTAFERTIKAGLHYKFDSTVPVPTTIAWATRDKILPYTQAGLAEERLPFAEHIALPHCGHVPMIDDPEFIVDVIDRTVAKTHQDMPRSAAA